jgi:hypothetical protein
MVPTFEKAVITQVGKPSIDGLAGREAVRRKAPGQPVRSVWDMTLAISRIDQRR